MSDKLQPFASPDVRSVSEQVYEHLVRAIVEGELAPKQELSDRALAEQLGVSRTPIREAFHQLESVGLVKRRSRIGWIVTEFGRQDVEELIELRSLLEAAGVRHVVRWSESRLRELCTLFDDFELPFDAEATADYLRRDREFHSAIVDATGNRRIKEVYRYVELQIDRVRHFISYRAQSRVAESLEEHRAITRALAQREATEASAAPDSHLLNVQYKFVDLLEAANAATAERR